MSFLKNKAQRERAGTIALLVWFLVVFFFYFKKSPAFLKYLLLFIQQYGYFSLWHQYSLKALAALGLASWIAWVTLRCGAQLLRKMMPESELSPLERAIFSAGLGIGIVSLVTFGLGILRLWYASLFWGLLIIATFGYFPRRRPRISWRHSFESTVSLREWWAKVALGLLAILGVIFLAGELSPEIFFDSLHYHLALPNLYMLNHRVYNEPNFAFAGFVMTIQMLWGFALTVGNTITAKLLHGGAAVLLFFAFVAFEQRYLSRGAGVLGAAFFFSMPVVGLNVMTAGIDVVWTALQFLAVFALTRALAHDHEEAAQRKWIRLAGVLTGLAASCKYTGLPVIPVAGVVILWTRRRQHRLPWNAGFREAGLFLIYASLLVSPHLVKNVIFHHNPVYPFAGTFLGEPRITGENWKNLTRDAEARTISEDFSSLQSFLRFVFHPWFITMSGGFVETYIGPILLGLLPLILFARPPGPAYSVLAHFTFGLWIVWLSTTAMVRHGMPLLAIISLLLAQGLLSLRAGFVARQLVPALCMVGVAWNLYLTFIPYSLTEGWAVLGGMISEHDYLSTDHATYPRPSYEALDWMNKNLPQGSKVMMAGDSRSYYARVPIVPSSIYDVQPIVAVTQKAKNGADMARLLREQGVTHVFVNLAEAVRTDSYRPFPWDRKSWTVLEDFWQNYVRLIWVNVRPPSPNPKALFVYQLNSDLDPRDPTSAAPFNPFERWKPSDAN